VQWWREQMKVIISTTGLIFAPDDVQTRRGLQRPDCVAGVGGLELRNVVAKYPFERSHRFPVIQPNCGRRDYSHSSCDGGRRSSALVPGSITSWRKLLSHFLRSTLATSLFAISDR